MPNPTSRIDVLRNLQTANLDVAFATAFGTLVSGTFLIGFIQYLGGGDYWIQAVVALPSFMGLFQIPGAIWGRRFPYYKRFVTPGGWIWRLGYIPLVFLPLLPWPNELKIWLLAISIGVATIATQTVGPIYNDWIAELVPPDSRGWYFSRRTAVSTAIGMGVAFVGGVLLDALQKQNSTGIGFSLLFFLGMVCAITSMFFFLRMKDTVRLNPIQKGIRESLQLMVKPARDRDFQKVLIFTIVFMISATMAGGLYVAFARESLKLSYTAIQSTQVAHAIGTVAFASMWGYLADKYGNKPLLIILMAGATITPIVWMLTIPGQPAYSTLILVIGHLFNGAVWSGIAVCQMNLYIATSRSEDRANYLGMVFAVQSIVGGIAPLLGGFLMHQFRGIHDAEHAYKLIFGLVIGIRVIAFLTLFPIREEGSSAIGVTLGQLGKVKPKGIRALRQLSKTDDAESKAMAIAAVGSAQMSLASGELLRALSDPSPQVRRNAARALGRLDDAHVATALSQFVAENRDLVDEETLEALGDIGAIEATGIVQSFLTDPRAAMRRQAAKTLGRLGSSDALRPLENAAADPTDPELRRAAIQALRLLNSPDASLVIGRALQDPDFSVRAAAAEAVSENKLTNLANEVRNSLQVWGDSYASELAYALGTVGNRSDAKIILKMAETAASSTSRRRCLLGLACLFNVEPGLYKLFNLEGLSRDQELMSVLKSGLTKSRKLREALQAFSLGQEQKAVRLLTYASGAPNLEEFTEFDIPELFLVASLVYAQVS